MSQGGKLEDFEKRHFFRYISEDFLSLANGLEGGIGAEYLGCSIPIQMNDDKGKAHVFPTVMENMGGTSQWLIKQTLYLNWIVTMPVS